MRTRRVLPSYTDDPARDWDSYCACQDLLHSMYPRCIECDETIDEYAFDFGDGPMCEECMIRLYRKPVEDWME